MSFDASFALTQMLPLAEAAYDLKKLPTGWTLISPIEPNNFGFVAEANGTRVISIRGTLSHFEWLENFDALAVESQYGAGRVHQGFQIAYSAIAKSIRAAQWTAKSLSNVWITGHSLGAALATLCAADFAHRLAEPLVYTFGGPRVGQSDFSTWFDRAIPECYRMVNRWDIVPDLPLAPGWRHVGQEALLDAGFVADGLTAHSLAAAYGPGLQRFIEHPISLLKVA